MRLSTWARAWRARVLVAAVLAFPATAGIASTAYAAGWSATPTAGELDTAATGAHCAR